MKLLDFSQHRGTHPTLGVIDNIVFSPLGSETMDTAKGQSLRTSLHFPSSYNTYITGMALSFASRLNKSHEVPVYLYGFASPSSMMLKDIRKKLGYFNKAEHDSSFQADMGTTSTAVSFKTGLSCVGAVPMVINLNMRFRPEDKRAIISQVTKSIREPGVVEALTLNHEGGAQEIACNLRNTKIRGVEELVAICKAKSAVLGLEMMSHYTTGPTEEELMQIYQRSYV